MKTLTVQQLHNATIATLLELTPFQRGYNARTTQRGMATNPFPRGSRESQSWENGWYMANRNLTH